MENSVATILEQLTALTKEVKHLKAGNKATITQGPADIIKAADLPDAVESQLTKVGNRDQYRFCVNCRS